MNAPLDHHYVPVFYLNRWKGEDGKICRFSRPHGPNVQAKRVSPKGTAFEPELYSVRGATDETAHAMESEFMAKIDSGAPQALQLLEQQLPDREWQSGPRSAWSRFILSQTLGTPADIAQLKSSIKEAWGNAIPELQAAYEEQRSERDPLHINDYLAQLDPGSEDSFALEIARRLMDHSQICQMLNNMHWLVRNLTECGVPLLTSDRPVWMTATLTEKDAFVSLPIAPNRMFFAAPAPNTIERIGARSEEALVTARNRLTIQHAVKFVYGIDDRMKDEIGQHMATRRHSTLLERLAVSRGHTIVDERSPSAPD